jgi:hypothetical protein
MFETTLLKSCKSLLLIGVLGLLQSCAIFSASEAQGILGSWTSQVGGFPVRVTYSESTLQIGDNAPVGYLLNDGQLTVSDDTAQTRMVSFPTTNEMIQLDLLTGTEHAFSRVK